jgi:hypothetical protein
MFVYAAIGLFILLASLSTVWALVYAIETGHFSSVEETARSIYPEEQEEEKKLMSSTSSSLFNP